MKKENKQPASKELFEQIVTYTDTESEAERRQKFDDELMSLCDRKAELEKKGNALIKKYGISIEDMIIGNYYKSDIIEPMRKELQKINAKIRELSNKKKFICFDDELQAIEAELQTITAERDETESLLNLKRKQLEESKGIMSFDEYKQLEADVYDLQSKLAKKRAEVAETLKKKGNYTAKIEVLLNEYETAKDTETRGEIKNLLQEALKMLEDCEAEKRTAEQITLARSGNANKTINEFNAYLTASGANWIANVKNSLKTALGSVD